MNAPTLLVGLGGKGSQIVQKVFERATPKQRENISFVVFDTDVNELRMISENTPQIRTIQTSTRLTVGEYLEIDKDSRDTWFPVNRILNGKALTEGAGQVRAVSRLALNTAIQQGRMAPLNEAIEDLYKLNGQSIQQSPRVIITGSLCGGTGSGLILPVSLYIRNFLTTKMQQGSAVIRGFFLLPEVFDGVIKTQSERNNLRTNAYAAIREIDAFMMKDDGSLPPRYNLEFWAPKAGSTIKEIYSGRPMDFCFLFDGQNLDGKKLNNHADYVEHAANCIYGMAIAPTSRRSNSSEDNVIREIVFAGGRNRFAGAGSSMLIFPTEDVKEYLALKWTKESVTGEWLEIDKVFEDELKSNRNQRAKGLQVPELNRGNHYIDVVNSGFAQKKTFESAIRNMCYQFDAEGFVEKGINWNGYTKSLKAFIDSRIREQKKHPTLQNMITNIREKSSADSQGGDEGNDATAASGFEEWYENLKGYETATVKMTQMLARTIAYTLFKEAKDYTNTDETYRLEYWLHKDLNKNAFIHPNAVRFFLYNALNELKRTEAKSRQQTNEIEQFWNGFEEGTFDLKDTRDHVESQEEFIEATYLNESNAVKRFFHRRDIMEAKTKLTSRFRKLYENIENYWNAYVYREVYHEAIQHINALCDAFHDFYDVLDRNVAKLDREIEQLENKYRVQEGQARRYVCADKKCLQGIASEVVNKSSSIELPSELSRSIFARMKSYALAEKKPASEEYFTKAFDDTVVEYLKSEISSHYSSIVDMDILSALEREAKYLQPEQMFDLEDERLYAKHVIESTEVLARPFIESPLGKEPRVIPACAFNPELITADFPGREGFVRTVLVDAGGVDDESIDKNMILFYQGVYDLRANELSKFAPPRKAETYKRPGGEYYRAYYELVNQIHPETVRSRVITPHIDRWWHVISKLPDLDEQSQETQEKRICAAFFWGMLGGFVELKQNGTTNRYCVVTQNLDLENTTEEKLIVSNGTPCDHLYEVLDSFTIYPRLVKLVLDRVRTRSEGDLYRKLPLEKTMLYSELRTFTVQEFKLEKGEDKNAVRSVFELPLLMKRSVPSEEYFQEDMLRLLGVILDEFKKYISRFVSQKERNGVYGQLIKDQFQLFLENVAADQKTYGDDVYSDGLFGDICRSIARAFESIDMYDEAEDIKEKLRKLRQ